MRLVDTWIEDNESKFYQYNHALSRGKNKVARDQAIQALYDHTHKYLKTRLDKNRVQTYVNLNQNFQDQDQDKLDRKIEKTFKYFDPNYDKNK